MLVCVDASSTPNPKRENIHLQSALQQENKLGIQSTVWLTVLETCIVRLRFIPPEFTDTNLIDNVER